MHMKRTFFVGALAALIIPISVSALSVDEIRAQIQTLMQQIEQLQGQIKTLTTTPVACTMDAKICPDGSSVGRVGPNCEFAACPGGGGGSDTTLPAWCARYGKLTYGTRGEDVSALQSAIGEADLGSVATGYYGELTRRAWNKRCVARCPIPVCSASVFVCPVGQHGAPAIPVYGANGCQTNWCAQRCVYDADATGVTISGVSGPTSLAVGQQGTWTVQASSASSSLSTNVALSYSVVWGDENAFSRIMEMAGGVDAFVQTATFTHAYANTGTYTVRFTVRDAAGATAETSLTVRVGGLECPVYNRPECLNGHIENVLNARGCQEPRCVMQNCLIPSCMALECPVGQHAVSDTPVYGASGCRTNSCAQHCVPDSSVGCAGPRADGGVAYDKSCPNPPIVNQTTGCAGPFTGGISAECASATNQNVYANGTATQDMGPLTGGGVVSGRTCTANGMNFAEGASVSQCIASGGANGCNTFSVVEPRSVCRGGMWVQ